MEVNLYHILLIVLISTFIVLVLFPKKNFIRVDLSKFDFSSNKKALKFLEICLIISLVFYELKISFMLTTVTVLGFIIYLEYIKRNE